MVCLWYRDGVGVEGAGGGFKAPGIEMGMGVEGAGGGGVAPSSSSLGGKRAQLGQERVLEANEADLALARQDAARLIARPAVSLIWGGFRV